MNLVIASHANSRVRFFAYDKEGKELYQSERDCSDEEQFARRYHKAFETVLLDHEEKKWQLRHS